MAPPAPMPEFGWCWFPADPVPTHCRWCHRRLWLRSRSVVTCDHCDETVDKNQPS